MNEITNRQGFGRETEWLPSHWEFSCVSESADVFISLSLCTVMQRTHHCPPFRLFPLALFPEFLQFFKHLQAPFLIKVHLWRSPEQRGQGIENTQLKRKGLQVVERDKTFSREVSNSALWINLVADVVRYDLATDKIIILGQGGVMH
ncbi:uncharacterized protein LOC111323041 [Stylophora pistillata]|uniref:uncharacterized protein LOC111323041 n=1 Tax=Stylophora pistillata TaxID=50429 RepID=UPI000C03AD58|nr:uncharacterized protein LOC111323041 [Stylophora pistillata]